MKTKDTRFHDLPLPGQLVVWASRHWLRAYSDGRMIPPCVCQSFAQAELVPAFRALTDALRVLAGHEIDPRAFGCPNAPRLTAEEARWVRLVLAGDETCWPSGREPCPAVSRVALEHLRTVERHFLRAGYSIALAPMAEEAAPKPDAFSPSALIPLTAALH